MKLPGIILSVAVACAASAGTTVKRLEIDTIFPGFPVGYCLLTAGEDQFVAYYNADRQMVVASRKVNSDKWTCTKLPSKVVWDSHNYITMVLDDDGYIHLSGNMHCVPLIYFRSTRPRDATTLVRVKTMVGPEEKRCTYPKFMRGAENELIFHYRTGSSGRGNEIYNVYDPKTRQWKRLLDKPLTDGRGRMNAYMQGPFKGPDGRFHMIWVWRNTPDCSTNHDLSYARTSDLRRWESVDGKPIRLPITLDQRQAIVDPAPPGGGLLNGGARSCFDSKQRIIIVYHRNDAAGNTQLYAARFENGKWRKVQLTHWQHRWAFKGGGSIGRDITFGAPRDIGHGRLSFGFRHVKYGNGAIMFDEATLEPIPAGDPRRKLPEPPKKPEQKVPGELNKVTSPFPGMAVRWRGDIGKPSDPGVIYRLRWETLPPNRDRPRKGKLPEPVKLELIEAQASGRVTSKDLQK